MLNRIYKICFASIILISPLFASAAGYLTDTSGLLQQVKLIVTDYLIPIAFTLALAIFFYGVAKYIWSAGTDKDEGKKIMVWGVVALFVMSSIWGIVTFLRGELNITGSDATMKIPTIK
ncbi:MAG: hypothetical protein AAB837_01725 [Patescibacteria group bacterium]